jgi:hypothetical protein
MQAKIVEKINRFLNWNNTITLIVFSITVIVLLFVYDYHKTLTAPPQSVHAWRQADCASQALNYAERDANFFMPQMHALISEDYTSGYCMQEFPVVYYFVSILYRVFGQHDFFFRGTVLALFLTGLVFLFFLNKRVTNDNFWAFSLTILLFTSPVIVFYANNFIMNIPAFSITIIAWAVFFFYVKNRRDIWLLTSIILFTLAALLKLSELISLLTVFGLLFLDYFRIIKFSKDDTLFKKPYSLALYIVLALVLVYGWYWYSHWFNNFYGQRYYIYTTTGSYFSLSPEDRKFIYEIISDYWVKYYHNTIVLIFYAATLALNFIFIRRTNKLLMAITSIMFAGSILFCIMFYLYLRNHDYYVISLYIATIFSTATLFELGLRRWAVIFKSSVFKLLFLALLVHSAVYAKGKMNIRYNGWENYNYLVTWKDMYTLKPYLEEIGVAEEARVVVLPDPSPNITLYLINRQGWTNLVNADNRFVLETGVNRGADYLIIFSPELLEDESISVFLTDKVGEHGNVTIFRLNQEMTLNPASEEAGS